MKRRVTLKQIAERAGVHLSTVSMALRNHPRISQQMRTKLQKLAQEMGYVPDPSMSALCSYRNAIRPMAVRSGLAYLTDMDPERPFEVEIFENARRRAAELGYNLIEYNLSRNYMSLERLHSIWWNQGLRGVLVGPFRGQTSLHGTWERWPVVAVGYSVEEPSFNRATAHHFQNTLSHLEELHARAYRRVGLCLPVSLDERTGGQMHGAYLLDAEKNGLKRVPPLFTQWPVDPAVMDEWVRRHKLEAVIGHPDHYQALLAAGWEVPQQIGFSLLTILHDVPGCEGLAGFDAKPGQVSVNSIDFLVSLIHEQACGLLSPPRFYLVSGVFREGFTVRPKP